MKKSLKKIGIFFSVFAPLLLCGFASATVVDTGAVTYTGTLSQFLTQEKTNVNTTLDMVYSRVYANFHDSGLNLMNTLNYQSLVCLGVMKQDDSLITQMQKDRQELKLAFLKDFLDIEADISTLEEKNRVQGETNISLYTYGTTYESEKARIAAKIEQTKTLHLGFIRNFETAHLLKLQNFINTVMEYSKTNTGVINFINDKLRKMQSIESSFAALTSGVNQISSLLIGSGPDFLASAQVVRTGFMNSFGARLQLAIDTAVKTYKKFTSLGSVLANEKDFAVRNYGLDFDEKLNITLNDRYSKKDYENIKAQISQLKTDYMSGGQLSCTKMYASPIIFENRINTLFDKVTTVASGIVISIETAKKPGSSLEVKADLMAGFADFNKKNLSKKIAEFKKIIRDRIGEMQNTSTSTTTINNVTITSTAPVIFTRPFKKGETGPAVKTLQELLQKNGYYDGNINSVFTKKTIEGIYQFQLKNGLLIGYEKRPATRGWMGPATRIKLNELLANPGTEENTITIQTLPTVQAQDLAPQQATGTMNTGTVVTGSDGIATIIVPYKIVITSILRGKITVAEKKAALDKALFNLNVSITKLTTGPQKTYLEGLATAIQTQLATLN